MTSSKARPSSSGASAAYAPPELARTMPCTARRVESSGRAEHVGLLDEHTGGEEQLVVHELGDRAGTRRSDVEDLAGERPEQRLDRGERVRSSPPAITLSSPESAFTLPPDTGASTKPMPAAAQRSCRRRGELRRARRQVDDERRGGVGGEHALGADDRRLDVVRCGQRQEHAPSVPAAAAAALDVERRAAPPASIAAALRSNTCTPCPASTRWRAIGAPIVPTPTNPISIVTTLRHHAPVRSRGRGESGALTVDDLDEVLALNNANVPAVSPLADDAELARLVGLSVGGPRGRVGRRGSPATAWCMPPGVDYASLNYRWFSRHAGEARRRHGSPTSIVWPWGHPPAVSPRRRPSALRAPRRAAQRDGAGALLRGQRAPAEPRLNGVPRFARVPRGRPAGHRRRQAGSACSPSRCPGRSTAGVTPMPDAAAALRARRLRGHGGRGVGRADGGRRVGAVVRWWCGLGRRSSPGQIGSTRRWSVTATRHRSTSRSAGRHVIGNQRARWSAAPWRSASSCSSSRCCCSPSAWRGSCRRRSPERTSARRASMAGSPIRSTTC